MADKFIDVVNGAMTQKNPLTTSTGVPDANRMVQTGSDGKLAESLMPAGVAADVKVVVAAEALSAYDLVNIYNDAGTWKARKADASNGYEAHGYVKESYSLAADATVYKDGSVAGQTGLDTGPIYLSETAGAATQTAPSTSGSIVQQVGFVTGATEFDFEYSQPITLA